jgi:hypothetical protein
MGVTEVVIGDVHARADVLRAMLRAIGALDASGRRRDGFWIVQVGDLLDRRAKPEANLRTARVAVDRLDVVVAGNHEVAMFGADGSPHGASLSTLAARGWPQAAAEVGGWVVTHAGVHPELSHGLPRTATECVAEINDLWNRRSRTHLGDPLFDWVGPGRGGVSPYGGVFWRSDSEWPPGATTPWGQICGHAPQPRPRLLPGPRWLIDVGADGGRLAALVRQQGAANWSPVMVKLTQGRVTVTRPPHQQVDRTAA